MTLREKILKTFVVTIREINAHGGPEKFFEKYPVGGLFYREFADGPFDENGNETGTGMTREKLELCKKYAPKDMLICADSGKIDGQDLFGATQMTLGGADDEEISYEWGKSIGMRFNSQGVDWSLGPSMDMFFTNSMPLMAISDDPKVTARIYRQVVRGIQDQGVCATIKHFPGLGTDSMNMHYAPGRNILPFDKWMETYGYTYMELIKEGPMCLMNTHTALRSYDNEFTDGYFPVATFSKKLNNDLLRDTLGFKGAIVTDAMIMGGNATGNDVNECAQAFKCGADLLLWPVMKTADRIEEMILSGEIPMSRLDSALEHIEQMKSFRKKALENKKYDQPSTEFVNKTARKLASNAICCLKNERNILPLDSEKYKKILLVDDCTEENDVSIDLLQKELESRGKKVEVVRGIDDKGSEVCWQADTDKLQEGQDLVIFNVRGTYLSDWNNTFMTIWGSHMFDKQRKLILIYGSPFYAPECFPEDPTIIEMNSNPTEFTVGEVVKKIFGEDEFKGKPMLRNIKDGVLCV